MKSLNKHLVWTLALALGGTVGAVNATAQDRDWRDRYDQNGYQDWDNNRAYQEGMRDGQRDRLDNQSQQYRGRYRNDPAYQEGYNRGYAQAGRGWGRDRNRAYGGYYGNGGYYGRYNNGNRAAQQVGYQDGVNDGAKDRQTGHSFRPTQQQAYRNADHNYSPSYGDRQPYK